MSIVPHQQITFAKWLKKLQGSMLQSALLKTVSGMDLRTIDDELHELVPHKYLSQLALYGLRGELLFAVPSVILKNPCLAGYYRLVLGLSRKEYEKHPILKAFAGLEPELDSHDTDLTIPSKSVDHEKVRQLCELLNSAACLLLDELDDLTSEFLHDLTLLTLGAQFRGSYNNTIGRRAAGRVFGVIKEILTPRAKVVTDEPGLLVVQNASGRRVAIRLGSDPDVLVTETVSSDVQRYLLSIEVKGGTDKSNIHNRLGEAEKTHLKCKAKGARECWTIVAVDIPASEAKAESPTTDRFYNIQCLENDTSEREDFTKHLVAIVGVRL